jgi:putative endonuclease
VITRTGAHEELCAWRVAIGEIVDRWYEEMPWRRGVSLGRRGEDLAARHLRRRGYTVLARNFRTAHAEIDLVALDRGTLAFVEVKTRTSDIAGTPEEAVGTDKQERIRHAAAAYAIAYRAGGRPIRFDVVAIIGAGRARRLELLKGAF